jgi:hypothetical protein
MYIEKQEDRLYEPINITDYVRTFLIKLSEREGSRVKVNTEIDAIRVSHLINNPKFTTFKSVNDIQTGQPYWNEQEIVYLPSNLGANKGYVFYFRCNGCDRRVKHLYKYTELEPPLCRKCHRLSYRQISYKERKARLTRNVRPNSEWHLLNKFYAQGNQ